MPIDVDGFAIIRSILDNPGAFPDISTEINKAAVALVSNQLKARTTTFSTIRAVHQALGDDVLANVLDGLTDVAIKALIKKLDKDNPELEANNANWHRRQIVLLARGDAEPAKKAKPSPKATPRVKKPKLTEAQAIAAKELKAKSIDLGRTRALWNEMGAETFRLILGTLTENQIAGLAKRLDRDNVKIGIESKEWWTERIVALGGSIAEPEYKNILESKAMAAKRLP
jgi:hypothetical protein